jgi:3',5'-cyclic AMP phosphodiesterase CpdA
MPSCRLQIKASGSWNLSTAIVAILVGILLASTVRSEELRFVFLADSRNDANFINSAALNDINSRIVSLVPKPAFVIFGGDMATYGLRADGSDNFQAFRNAMHTITAAGIKLYVVLGNHELYQEASGGTQMFRANQLKYQQVFADMPGNGPTDDFKRLVYSFTSPGGDSFFAVLDPFYMDPNTPQRADNGRGGSIDNTQLTWLANQLAQTVANHKFLFIHVPAYYVVTSTDTFPTYMNLWSLLDSNRFNIYFCGHTHIYARKSIDRRVDLTRTNNVVQLINGGAGAPFNLLPIVRDAASWHIKSNQYFFTVVDIRGKQVKVTTYGGINGNYNPVDRFSIPPIASPAINDLLSLVNVP